MGRVHHRGKLGWFYQDVPTTQKKSQREEVFVRIKPFGSEASIVWGWHPAASITSWRAEQNEKGEWRLTATASELNPFYLRQTSPTLLFNAGPGRPSWPIEEIWHDGRNIRARLGPVEF